MEQQRPGVLRRDSRIKIIFIICIPTKYYSADQIKNVVGKACSMNGEQKPEQPNGGESRSKKEHLEDNGVDDRIILKWTFKKIG
jgi:hypothetical protein